MGVGRGKIKKIESRRVHALLSPNEVVYSPSGTEIIVNPTDSQYRQLRKEFKEENPTLVGEPPTRTTYDIDGNTYLWRSDSNTHYFVENFIDRNFETLTHQNKYFDVKYDEEVVQAHLDRIKNSPKDKLSYSELMEFNNDKWGKYKESLNDNVNLVTRASNIRREVSVFTPTDPESFDDAKNEAQFSTRVRNKVLQPLSVKNGDSVLDIDYDSGLSESEWKKVFENFGGTVGAYLTSSYAFNQLSTKVKGRIRNPKNPPKVNETEKLLLDKLEVLGGALSQRTVQKAFINMGNNASPFSDNNEAYGKVFWDLKYSPTEQINRPVRARMINTLGTLNTLVEIFQKSFPKFSPLKSVVFEEYVATEQGALAFYEELAKEITITTRVLNPSFDRENARDGVYTVANAGGFPLMDAVIHEFGHAVHFELLKKTYADPVIERSFGKNRDVFVVDKRSRDRQAEVVNKFYGDVEVLSAVSPYGNSNRAEAFAEAFTL